MTSKITDVFYEQVARRPRKVALRWFDGGTWEETTWEQYIRAVEEVAFGLLSLSVCPGDRVGVLSANRPEWLFADLGIMAMGGVTVPIHPNLAPAQLRYPVAHSEMKLLIVENDEQRDKVRKIRHEIPALEGVVVITGPATTRAITWQAMLERGRGLRQRRPSALRDAQKVTRADEALATIIYTSGASGPPRGVMLSHGNLVFGAEQASRRLFVGSEHERLSFSSLSDTVERLQSALVAIREGDTVSFARSADTLIEDLQAVRPTVLTCVPPLWEKVEQGIMRQLLQKSRTWEWVWRWALRYNRDRWQRQLQARPVGLKLRLLAGLGDLVVGRQVRRRLGLDRVRHLISGAAPLSADLHELFGALRLPIQSVYGQPECTAVSHGTPPTADVRPGSVGVPLLGVDVRIADDGEILLRGGNVFAGYFKDDAATADVLEDGWLHTGDVGHTDADGYLWVADRKKDIIVTEGGASIAPQNLESRLKAWPGISQVVVLGERRKYLVALVTVDREAAAQALGQPLRNPPSSCPVLNDYVQRAVDVLNADLSSSETIRRFRILDEELHASKRRVAHARFNDVIEQLYAA